MDELRQSARQEAEALLATTQREAAETEARGLEEFSLPKYVELGSAKCALQEASSAARSNTYYGYLNSVAFCKNARQQLQHAIAQFTERANADAIRRITELDNNVTAIWARNVGGGWLAVAYLGVILSIAQGCYSCNQVSKANERQKQIRLDANARLLAEIRSKGYDPAKLPLQQVDGILGYRAIESLPPWDTGSSPSGTWFFYSFFGSALVVTIVAVGNYIRRRRAVDRLEHEKLRLQRIRSELGYP